MTYDPQHPDYSHLENTVEIIIIRNGKVYSLRRPLGDAFTQAEGPMSLEAACMWIVREICQAIRRKRNINNDR